MSIKNLHIPVPSLVQMEQALEAYAKQKGAKIEDLDLGKAIADPDSKLQAFKPEMVLEAHVSLLRTDPGAAALAFVNGARGQREVQGLGLRAATADQDQKQRAQ